MVALQLLAAIAFGTVFLLFLQPDASDIVNGNAVIMIALISSWILYSAMSGALAKKERFTVGFGFPLKTEFHFPVSTFSLAAVPLLFCVFLTYLCFLLPTLVLASAFGLPLPHPMIHFMVFEYLFLVMCLAWFSTHGVEIFIATLTLILLFYFELIIPEFAFHETTYAFMPGHWSSTLPPLFITGFAILVLFAGVSRQRSGENLLIKSAGPVNFVEILSPLNLYRFLKTDCPTHSATAAMFWHERQSRGLQAACGVGVTLGVLVLVVIALLQVRDDVSGDWTLEEVSSFAFIFYCSVVVGSLASMLGINFKYGAAYVSVFDRTLPMSTARILAIRAGTAVAFILIVAVVEILTILVLGSLVIENFQAMQAEYFANLRSVLDRGMLYTSLRLILLVSFIYTFALLWAVFISWFAIKPRMMTILFSSLMVYGVAIVVLITALTDGQEFVRLTNTIADLHRWFGIAFLLGSIVYFMNALAKEKVLGPGAVLILCGLGLVLAALNLTGYSLASDFDPNAELANRLSSQVAGLWPLAATVIALWTQQRFRHC